MSISQPHNIQFFELHNFI